MWKALQTTKNSLTALNKDLWRNTVPFIECHIKKGLTQAQREQLIRDIIQVTHDSIGSDPKIINVILHEHPAGNISISSRINGEDFKQTKTVPAWDS